MPRTEQIPLFMNLGRETRILLLVLVALVASLCVYGYVHWRVTRFDFLIQQASKKHDLDYDLVKSLIHEESWYDPDVRGADGELGLMQVTSLVRTE